MPIILMGLLAIIVVAALVFLVLVARLSVEEADMWLRPITGVMLLFTFIVGAAMLITGYVVVDKLSIRVANAETESSNAKRDLLEVQDKLAWRHSFDVEKFREVLEKGTKSNAEIVYLKDDSEANIFADSIWFALSASGWRVEQPRPGKESPDSRMSFFLREAGVLVTNKPQLAVLVSSPSELVAKPYKLNTPAGTLMAAFDAVEREPLHAVLDHGMPPNGAIKIVVGSRF